MVGVSARRAPPSRDSTPRRRPTRAMRAVIQRVSSASVSVDGAVVARIGPGALCLVGVHEADAAADAEWLARKVAALRLWPAPGGDKAWDASLATLPDLQVLCVSQFTLHARVKGTRPDYCKAAKPETARGLYGAVLARLAAELGPGRVHDGVFGAMMAVELVNDGPVTLVVDSPGAAAGGGSGGGGGGGGG